jgi:hypothetical protein
VPLLLAREFVHNWAARSLMAKFRQNQSPDQISIIIITHNFLCSTQFDAEKLHCIVLNYLLFTHMGRRLQMQ